MISSASVRSNANRPISLWEEIPGGDAAEFDLARSETLNLVQWLARIANSYVSGKLPEDRVMLEFRAENTAFVTQTFAHGVALEMRLKSLEMQFLENGRLVPHIFDPEEHSPAKVEAWLLVELLHRGIDRNQFSKKLPYAVANLKSGDAENHSPQACQNGLAQLVMWFRNAASVLSVAGGGSKIFVLPQTLTLVCSRHNRPEQKIGFSIGADGNEPYFFVEAAGRKDQSVLKASQLLKEADRGANALQFMGVA